jgi:hypothetical protein
MKGIREEAEVIIRLDQIDGKAHICVSSWPAMYRKMLRLHGDPKDGPAKGQVARWIVPLEAVLLRKGKKVMTITRMPFGAPRSPLQPRSGAGSAPDSPQTLPTS